jgi:hypothetical protein
MKNEPHLHAIRVLTLSPKNLTNFIGFYSQNSRKCRSTKNTLTQYSSCAHSNGHVLCDPCRAHAIHDQLLCRLQVSDLGFLGSQPENRLAVDIADAFHQLRRLLLYRSKLVTKKSKKKLNADGICLFKG